MSELKDVVFDVAEYYEEDNEITTVSYRGYEIGYFDEFEEGSFHFVHVAYNMDEMLVVRDFIDEIDRAITLRKALARGREE